MFDNRFWLIEVPAFIEWVKVRAMTLGEKDLTR